jgi:hypothetical protein
MPKARTALNDEVKKILEEVGNEVVAALKGEFYEVDGTPMATVKYDTGAFKKKPLMPTWLFQIEYAYVGAMGKIQFGLSPEDAQEYKFVEMHPKEMDDAFPLVGPAVAKHFGIEGENLKIVLDAELTRRLNVKADAAEVERKQTEAALEQNELFGAF